MCLAILAMVAISNSSGCAIGDEPGGAIPLTFSQPAPRTYATLDTDLPLPFQDSAEFDNWLASELATTRGRVEVRPTAPLDANNLPDRLERWLLAIQQTGGRVRVQRDMGGNSAKPLALDMAVRQIDSREQRANLHWARDYDAVVFYDEATKQVTSLLFSRRPLRR